MKEAMEAQAGEKQKKVDQALIVQSEFDKEKLKDLKAFVILKVKAKAKVKFTQAFYQAKLVKIFETDLEACKESWEVSQLLL